MPIYPLPIHLLDGTFWKLYREVHFGNMAVILKPRALGSSLEFNQDGQFAFHLVLKSEPNLSNQIESAEKCQAETRTAILLIIKNIHFISWFKLGYKNCITKWFTLASPYIFSWESRYYLPRSLIIFSIHANFRRHSLTNGGVQKIQ